MARGCHTLRSRVAVADAVRLRTTRRRFNALTGEWVFVSAQRVERPWQGRHTERLRQCMR
ncbi:MAG: hypothetical protein E6K35_05625 [Gammaproteobacteria bacterium]|nr:MAG: hypothetical protein E6K47_05900 [Gammaproteobacteria bacterium]TLY87282.1 MAG: hypothetical protein E6K35_05625 [Gammaproteobacteria bacterium]